MTTPQGKLITLEGGEGAGKSTLLQSLSTHLAACGIEVLVVREPGGTLLGEALRELMLDPARQLVPEAELLLMFAARAQLVREVIRPALAVGRWVLCDRYVDASYAYQGGGRGQPEERIRALAEWVCGDTWPALTFLLDLPVAAGRDRAARRGNPDRIEAEADGFFERVREVYRQRATAEPRRFCVLDASASLEAVFQAALPALTALLAEQGQ